MHAGLLTDSVREKLENLLVQDAELAAALESPEVLADHIQVRDLSIKRSAIEPVVTGFTRFRALEAEAADLAETIEAAEDVELVEMARTELPEIEAEAEKIIEAVQKLRDLSPLFDMHNEGIDITKIEWAAH